MGALSIVDTFQQAVWTTLLAALPVLLVAMLLGLVIGILQTATSIQEQTLVFVPKILAVLLALVLFGPWIFGKVGKMTVDILGQLHRFIQ
ncbi:MAG: flagellar biosynthesis protein FliQ [Synergistales bacterium]|jgi:flagellar biosynthetic protein FliQ|nr:flagellar biosynthesis protein FliQ [Synergistales bacterium]